MLLHIDIEKRIEHYTQRASERLPLFEDGEPAPNDSYATCAGCGLRPKKQNHLQMGGWVGIRIAGLGGETGKCHMVYCPDCSQQL